MSYYLLYAHASKILVKKGTTLNGKHDVVVIGSTGNSTGAHLHFGVATSPSIRGFDTVGTTKDPNIITDKYGRPTPNDITLKYGATTYPYSPSFPHSGYDYSGLIDKPYEEPNAYSPPNAKCSVYSTGYDSAYGNYVILKVLGEKVTTKYYFKVTGAKNEKNRDDYDVNRKLLGGVYEFECVNTTYLFTEPQLNKNSGKKITKGRILTTYSTEPTIVKATDGYTYYWHKTNGTVESTKGETFWVAYKRKETE